MEVKLKKYQIRRAGSRGLTISLPQNWVNLQNLQQHDHLLISQDERGRLIIEKLAPEAAAS